MHDTCVDEPRATLTLKRFMSPTHACFDAQGSCPRTQGSGLKVHVPDAHSKGSCPRRCPRRMRALTRKVHVPGRIPGRKVQDSRFMSPTHTGRTRFRTQGSCPRRIKQRCDFNGLIAVHVTCGTASPRNTLHPSSRFHDDLLAVLGQTSDVIELWKVNDLNP
jgi:hypothetical protein